ncbi:TPA: hypothetical protein MCT41_005573 [Klebsiella pneumoniae]|nr:hypothetical protein [Salmonella enterica]HBT9155153.1 hypothetical protein [Klebsiella pneumoniae]EHF1343803.1 hypothetical protein [Salmonella enterica]HBU2038185.1 hypothetical protein [Klebsiella pneumoniae]HBU2268012.1 hypothetical protein [Klebsiella pneumoniae]
MKKNTTFLSVAAAGCLFFSGLTFASFERPERVIEPVLSPSSSAVPEQITTNVLLRQILAEVIKGNAQKADNRCSDGEKNYSPGYIISAGKKSLRCDVVKGYPEWVSVDNA